MADVNANHAEDLRTIKSKDILNAICRKKEFEFVDEFKTAQQGA